MVVLKILLAAVFVIVFIQDSKDRYVYWFLFPSISILCGYLFYKNTLPELFLTSTLINVTFILVLILILALYARFKLKTTLLSTIGLGDILLFLALSASFSTISFIVIFICSLIFSLALHLYKTSRSNLQTTVPLAGYMSLFFLVSYVFHWTGFVNVVYTF